MFMRKKPEPAQRKTHDLTQFGLTEIPDDFDPTNGCNDIGENDSDLEAELAAISGGDGSSAVRKTQPKVKLTSDLDKMIADSLKDIGSDEEEDVDIENDTALLGELNNITEKVEFEEGNDDLKADKTTSDGLEDSEQTFLPTSTVDIKALIQQRIEIYKIAESNAKLAGESAKARRFGRGLKTLLEQQKQANAGKVVEVDDIPPEVSVKPNTNEEQNQTESIPSRVAPPPPEPMETSTLTPTSGSSDKLSPSSNSPTASSMKSCSSILEKMRERQLDYKSAALQAKRKGDTSVAVQFLKVVKQFDMVIKMVENGQEVDLSDMPPSPDQFMELMSKLHANAGGGNGESCTKPAPLEIPDPVNDKESLDTSTLSMLEALQGRLDKYKSVAESASTEGNTSKSRRFGRIVKQYEDAIKQYKAGSPVAYDELPVPPGFGPLPVENVNTENTAPAPAPTDDHSSQSSNSNPPAASSSVSPHKHNLTTRTSGNQQKNNLAEQQMKTLLDRQKEFKIAAIDAKKAGEIDQAKEYLKIYKGFDALLNAASSGLPVDLSTLPLPPSQRENLEASFAIITTEDCDSDDDLSDIGIRIEEQLAKQLMMCKNTRDHHKAMGDVAGMNRFENLALTVQKDLDLVRFSKRRNLSVPKFHYEKRSFNIVHCNTELTDNEMEIIVVRGLNYNAQNAKDIDTYIKIEFPLLNDETFKAKTPVVKNTDSPNYGQSFKVEIQRGNRQFQRIFKRHGVKFEVYSRGGFLRSDALIGTVNVKLQPLETKCDIHDTFNLMEGRKAVGGKLEIKLRVRNPILTKQVEHIEEKWLVLDA